MTFLQFVGDNVSVQRFGWSRRSDGDPSLFEPRELLHAYENRSTREVRDSGELLIEIPLSDASIVEITVLDASAGWIDSRVRGLCSSLDKIDRRAQRVLRGGFTIGWIELESERHGVIDYWENGVNNEYPISIVWNGNSWEGSGKHLASKSGAYIHEDGVDEYIPAAHRLNSRRGGQCFSATSQFVTTPAVSEQLCRLHTSGLRPPKHSASHAGVSGLRCSARCRYSCSGLSASVSCWASARSQQESSRSDVTRRSLAGICSRMPASCHGMQ